MPDSATMLGAWGINIAAASPSLSLSLADQDTTWVDAAVSATGGGGGGGTVNLAVSATGDNGYEYPAGAGGSWVPNSDPIYMGNVSGTNLADGGFRFLNATVPQGATINSATFSLVAEGSNGTLSGVNVRISAGAYDNAPPYDATHRPSQDTPTSAHVDLAPPAAWTPSTTYAFDVTAVIQEIVSRGGWVSGNAIRINVVDNGSAAGDNITAPIIPTHAALLDITYH